MISLHSEQITSTVCFSILLKAVNTINSNWELLLRPRRLVRCISVVGFNKTFSQYILSTRKNTGVDD